MLSSRGDSIARQDELISNLSTNYSDPDLTTADKCMLDYALKLTRTPGEMCREDVEALREVGFDDRGIHDICSIVGYFNFVNRTADGLGVELEERFTDINK